MNLRAFRHWLTCSQCHRNFHFNGKRKEYECPYFDAIMKTVWAELNQQREQRLERLHGNQ